MATVAYQGHAGAFSDVAARELVPGAQTRGYPSFDAAVQALDSGEVDYAVLPVENAIVGPVPRNYELLWEHAGLRIRGETKLPIELCLIGVAGATLDGIQEVRSHPRAPCRTRARTPRGSFCSRPPAQRTGATTSATGRASGSPSKTGPARCATRSARSPTGRSTCGS